MPINAYIPIIVKSTSVEEIFNYNLVEGTRVYIYILINIGGTGDPVCTCVCKYKYKILKYNTGAGNSKTYIAQTGVRAFVDLDIRTVSFTRACGSSCLMFGQV